MSEIIWDGKGLPPIGCRCEVKRNCFWKNCEILGHAVSHGEKFIIFQIDGRWDSSEALSDFRPIKSERDKAIEDLDRIWVASVSMKEFIANIYDEGYRKVNNHE